MEELPETQHKINMVISKLMEQAKLLFGDRVSWR
jgi:hypothetical protein